MPDDGSKAPLRFTPTPQRTPQDDLIERATQVLSGDERVLGVWLTGSYAAGTHDAFSDVDLWVVVEDGQVEAFCREWPTLCDEIAPTVLRQQVGNTLTFNHVTTTWLRFDISIGTPADIHERSTSTVKPLYDPGGLSAGLRGSRPPLLPDHRRVASLAREFLRVLGLAAVVIGREEYVVGVSGVGLLREMLIQLMLQDVAVEDRGGALHLNRLLPPHRLKTLVDLPAMAANRESVLAGHVACADAFLPLAYELHMRCGLDWPQDLEDATRRHLTASLGLPVAAWPGAGDQPLL